jgi:hypothetical protein
MRSVKGALAQPHTITPREGSGIDSTPVLTKSLTSDSMVTVLGRLDLEPRPGATKSERTSCFDDAPLIGFPRGLSSLVSDEVGAESLRARPTKKHTQTVGEGRVSLLVGHVLPLIRFTSC